VTAFIFNSFNIRADESDPHALWVSYHPHCFVVHDGGSLSHFLGVSHPPKGIVMSGKEVKKDGKNRKTG
jgi:hypothetical protein